MPWCVHFVVQCACISHAFTVKQRLQRLFFCSVNWSSRTLPTQHLKQEFRGQFFPCLAEPLKPFNTSNDLQRIFTPKASKTYCRLSDPPCFPKSVTIDDMSFMPHRFLKPGSVFARTCSIWQQHCDFYDEHASHQIPETAGARISLCFCLKFLIAFGCCWNLRHLCNIW